MREVINAFNIPCFALPPDYLQEDKKMTPPGTIDGNCIMTISNNDIFGCLTQVAPKIATCNSLFVFPAQCNFSGVKYPLEWISASQDGKLSSRLKSEFCINKKNVDISGDSDWYCLLDAASYVSTNPLGEQISLNVLLFIFVFLTAPIEFNRFVQMAS